jgi:hypothetical protein
MESPLGRLSRIRGMVFSCATAALIVAADGNYRALPASRLEEARSIMMSDASNCEAVRFEEEADAGLSHVRTRRFNQGEEDTWECPWLAIG